MFTNYDFHFPCLPILFVANSIPRRAALSSQKSFFVERPAVLPLSIEKKRRPKPTLLEGTSAGTEQVLWNQLREIKKKLIFFQKDDCSLSMTYFIRYRFFTRAIKKTNAKLFNS